MAWVLFCFFKGEFGVNYFQGVWVYPFKYFRKSE
jgi:hypothetical protein